MNFEDYFRCLWDYDPFPWQEELARRIKSEGKWPEIIEAPTSAGKTALIDIAVYALAMGWKAAATRIFFVVDRRIVVDEAKERADEIAKKIESLDSLSIMKGKLAALSDTDQPLHVSIMRGGMPLETAWAKSPTQSTVCLTTVDQLGSRLLFRGYGVSQRMAPIHAGLAATDSLIILDEAHLSEPFRQTLKLLRLYRSDKWCQIEVGGPLQVTFMSATLPSGKIKKENIFPFKEIYRENEEVSPVLKKRLKASKQASLIKVGDWKPPPKSAPIMEKKRWRDEESGRRKAFVSKILEKARESLRLAHEPCVIGVILNRVGTARDVHGQLSNLIKSESLEVDAILLTGRCRALDRDQLIEKHRDRIKANRDPSEGDRPIFVVATQCIEAGANIDFNALITEIASIDALRQRFGRLDRLGCLGKTKAWIVARSDSAHKSVEDPIYGNALYHSFKLLERANKLTKKQKKTTGKLCIGFGIDEFKSFRKKRLEEISKDEFQKLKRKNANQSDKYKKRSGNDLANDAKNLANSFWNNCLAPRKKAPVLMPSHLDYFAQTNPRPSPDPDPAVFLHGPNTEPAEINLVWRADLPNESDQWVETLSLVPPSSMETLSLPFGVAKKWLLGRLESDHDFSDIEAETINRDRESSQDVENELPNQIVIWRGKKESICVPQKSELTKQLRPGDTVVIRSSAGGLDQYGWNLSSNDSVADIADVAHSHQKGRSTLRLHPSLLDSWKEPDQDVSHEEKTNILRMLKSLRLDEADEEKVFSFNKVKETLSALAECQWLKSDIRTLAQKLNSEGFRHRAYPDGSGWIVISKKDLAERPVYLWEDEDSAFTEIERRELKAHTTDIENVLNDWLEKLSFHESAQEALKSFPRLHDVGKADPRFQDFLYGGPYEGAGEPPIAKSEDEHLTKEEFRNRWGECGLPTGWRHELVSLDLIEQNPSYLNGMEKEIVALLKHLIATHHGFCRAMAPMINDENPPPVSFENLTLQPEERMVWGRLNSGLIDRFASLQRQYGWYGLAFLEAIARLSDHVASAKLSSHD